jgi:hypothetical protein
MRRDEAVPAVNRRRHGQLSPGHEEDHHSVVEAVRTGRVDAQVEL